MTIGGDRPARRTRGARKVAVLGAGSWGTALALHLARTGDPVVLWTRSQDTARELREAGENTVYLPGHRFPPGLEVTGRLEEALEGARLVLFVVPAQHLRPVFRSVAASLPVALGSSFDGVGEGFTGPGGTFHPAVVSSSCTSNRSCPLNGEGPRRVAATTAKTVAESLVSDSTKVERIVPVPLRWFFLI